MPIPLLGIAAGTAGAWLFAALRIFLLANLMGFVVRIMAAFGLYFFVVGPVTDELMGVMTGEFGVVPQVVADWLGFFNFDKYVGLIISAYAINAGANFALRLNR